MSLATACLVTNLSAQINNDITKPIRIGFTMGNGSQSRLPLNNSNYSYSNKSFAVFLQKPFSIREKFSFEYLISPTYYIAEHQLLNKYFISPKAGEDYLKQREKYAQKISFNEFALNTGVIVRYKLLKPLSTYIFGSVGPMYSGADTERLKKGFAFSDIIGLGFSANYHRYFFDFKWLIRHNSNANLAFPNHGHNSVSIDVGCSYSL